MAIKINDKVYSRIKDYVFKHNEDPVSYFSKLEEILKNYKSSAVVLSGFLDITGVDDPLIASSLISVEERINFSKSDVFINKDIGGINLNEGDVDLVDDNVKRVADGLVGEKLSQAHTISGQALKDSAYILRLNPDAYLKNNLIVPEAQMVDSVRTVGPQLLFNHIDSFPFSEKDMVYINETQVQTQKQKSTVRKRVFANEPNNIIDVMLDKNEIKRIRSSKLKDYIINLVGQKEELEYLLTLQEEVFLKELRTVKKGTGMLAHPGGSIMGWIKRTLNDRPDYIKEFYVRVATNSFSDSETDISYMSLALRVEAARNMPISSSVVDGRFRDLEFLLTLPEDVKSKVKIKPFVLENFQEKIGKKSITGSEINRLFENFDKSIRVVYDLFWLNDQGSVYAKDFYDSVNVFLPLFTDIKSFDSFDLSKPIPNALSSENKILRLKNGYFKSSVPFKRLNETSSSLIFKREDYRPMLFFTQNLLATGSIKNFTGKIDKKQLENAFSIMEFNDFIKTADKYVVNLRLWKSFSKKFNDSRPESEKTYPFSLFHQSRYFEESGKLPVEVFRRIHGFSYNKFIDWFEERNPRSGLLKAEDLFVVKQEREIGVWDVQRTKRIMFDYNLKSARESSLYKDVEFKHKKILSLENHPLVFSSSLMLNYSFAVSKYVSKAFVDVCNKHEELEQLVSNAKGGLSDDEIKIISKNYKHKLVLYYGSVNKDSNLVKRVFHNNEKEINYFVLDSWTIINAKKNTFLLDFVLLDDSIKEKASFLVDRNNNGLLTKHGYKTADPKSWGAVKNMKIGSLIEKSLVMDISNVYLDVNK